MKDVMLVVMDANGKFVPIYLSDIERVLKAKGLKITSDAEKDKK